MKPIKVMLNNKELQVKYSTFPAGEEYIKLEENEVLKENNLDIQVVILSADSKTLMQSCLIADAIKRINSNSIVTAVLDYLPYGRQDRVCSNGESFSLSFIADVLKLRFDYIQSHDVHSQVSYSEFGKALKSPSSLYKNQAYMDLSSNLPFKIIDDIILELKDIKNSVLIKAHLIDHMSFQTILILL